MAARQSRNLLVVALVLVAFAGALVWVLLTPPPEDEGEQQAVAQPPPLEPPAEAAAPEEPVAAPAPAPQAAEQQEPTDDRSGEQESADFFAGDMPDFMAVAHLRVLDGKRLGPPQLRQLYDWSQEHKDDARPQLLMAWDSLNRNWDGFAVRHYRSAYDADQRAAQDPAMLRDLLAIAARRDRVEFRETVELVERAFGRDALPKVDDKLDELRAAGNKPAVERLTKLRDQIIEP